MTDLRRALERRSERGTPIGSDRLRQRVAFELAGGHMRPEDSDDRTSRLLLVAAAAVIVLVAIGGVMLLGGGDEPEIAATTPTTVPTTTTVAALPSLVWTEAELPSRIEIDEIIEAGPGLVATGCVIDVEEATTYGGQRYFAFTRHWAIWASEDGVTWTARLTDEAAEMDPGCIPDIAVTPSGLVAVGTAEGPSGYRGVVWLSDDGLAWEHIDPEAMQGGGEIVEEIEVTADGTLVAAGSSGNEARVWTSPDGREWTSVADDDLLVRSFVEDLVATPAGLLMIGTDRSSEYFPKPAAWFSPNGTDWERIPPENFASSDPTGAVEHLITIEAMTDGTWVVGDLAERIWASDDGVDWEPLYEAGLVGDFVPLPKWAGHGDRLLAVRAQFSDPDRGDPDNGIWISVDGGRTWFEDESSGIPREVTMFAVFSFGDGFVAVGAESSPYTAPDPEDEGSARLWVGTWDD